MFYVTSSRVTAAGNVDLIMRAEDDKTNTVYITTLPAGDVPANGTRIDATVTPWVDADGNAVAPVTLAPETPEQTAVTIHRVDLDVVVSVTAPASRAAANADKLRAAGWC